jgi:hypothetical protein
VFSPFEKAIGSEPELLRTLIPARRPTASDRPIGLGGEDEVAFGQAVDLVSARASRQRMVGCGEALTPEEGGIEVTQSLET